jgi:hypothetical protein
MVLFLICTLNDGDAIRRLLLHQYPQFTQLLNLMRVSYASALGKLGYGEVFSSFVEKVTGLVFPVI